MGIRFRWERETCGEQVGRPYRCLAMVSLVAFPRDKKMTLSSLAERGRSKTQKSWAASGAAAENRDRDSSTKSNVLKRSISLLICPLEASEVGLCQNMTISVWSSHLRRNFQHQGSSLERSMLKHQGNHTSYCDLGCFKNYFSGSDRDTAPHTSPLHKTQALAPPPPACLLEKHKLC